jgi:hypothetical protein
MAKNSVFLLIRHAEKPDSGRDLSPEGTKHAKAYVRLFSQYHAGPRLLTIDALFAAADSKASARPRLTLTPLAEALHLPIGTEYEDKQTAKLASRLLGDEFDGKTVVICWKHGEIMSLANALVGNPSALPREAHWPEAWPEDEFSWILQIVFDAAGKLDVASTYCIQHPAL